MTDIDRAVELFREGKDMDTIHARTGINKNMLIKIVTWDDRMERSKNVKNYDRRTRAVLREWDRLHEWYVKYRSKHKTSSSEG